MTTIYFTNHQEIQLVSLLKKYPYIIYVKSSLECVFQKFKLEQNQKHQCLDTQIQ